MVKKPSKTAKVSLSREAAAVFRDLLSRYEWSSDQKLKLTASLAQYDRFTEAAAKIRQLGLLFRDSRGNWKANPACAIEASAHKNFFAGMRALGLKSEAGDILPDYVEDADAEE